VSGRDAIPPASLGVVESGVRPSDDCLYGIVAGRNLGNPDATGEPDGSGPSGCRQRSAFAHQSTGKGVGRGEVRFRQQYCEFLAADAAEHVRLASLMAQQLGEALENFVPGRVTERVVYGLEEVEISEQYSKRAPVALGPSEFHFPELIPPSARAQFRQRVTAGETFKCVPGDFQLRYLCRQPLLQRGEANAYANARPQLFEVKRFDDIVVGPSAQPAYDIAPFLSRRQHDDVETREGGVLSDPPAEFQSVDSWHHPVNDSQRDASLTTQRVPRVSAIARRDHLKSFAPQGSFENGKSGPIVVGDERRQRARLDDRF